MIDILLKYILLYDFFNDLDAHSDFEKNCHKKAGQVELFLSYVCSNFFIRGSNPM